MYDSPALRQVFEAIDNLLLLQKDGICVYNGPVAGIRAYLQSAPSGEKYALSPGANPADHHALDIFCGPGGAGVDWPSLYKQSEMKTTIQREHEVDASEMGAIAVDTKPQSFFSELYLEVQRELVIMSRTPEYVATRMWWTISASLIVGVMYFDAGGSENVPNLFFCGHCRGSHAQCNGASY